MTISTRLTRAAVAFLIFGTVASVLPMETSALAAPGYPGVSNGRGRGRQGAAIAGVAAVGGLFALGRGGGGLFPYAAGKKKKRSKKEMEEERQRQEMEKLDRFTRPTDAASNPSLNH